MINTRFSHLLQGYTWERYRLANVSSNDFVHTRSADRLLLSVILTEQFSILTYCIQTSTTFPIITEVILFTEQLKVLFSEFYSACRILQLTLVYLMSRIQPSNSIICHLNMDSAWDEARIGGRRGKWLKEPTDVMTFLSLAAAHSLLFSDFLFITVLMLGIPW